MKVKITAFERVEYVQYKDIPDELWKEWEEVVENDDPEEAENFLTDKIYCYIDVHDVCDAEFVELDMWEMEKVEEK